jgi:hypothetical protein
MDLNLFDNFTTENTDLVVASATPVGDVSGKRPRELGPEIDDDDKVSRNDIVVTTLLLLLLLLLLLSCLSRGFI